MLETVAIPILLKAIDFIFGEGSKILEERRKRRQKNAEEQNEKYKKPPLSINSKQPNLITSKEEALRQNVIRSNWLASEERVKHLLSLLEIYTKNYYLAREKYAQWGDALVPPIVLHELTQAEDKIEEIVRELELILSNVYNMKISVFK